MAPSFSPRTCSQYCHCGHCTYRMYLHSMCFWVLVLHSFPFLFSPLDIQHDRCVRYSIVAEAANDLPFLQKSIGAVLIFVGLRIIGEFVGAHVSNEISLGIVILMLGFGVLVSVVQVRTGAKYGELMNV